MCLLPPNTSLLLNGVDHLLSHHLSQHKIPCAKEKVHNPVIYYENRFAWNDAAYCKWHHEWKRKNILNEWRTSSLARYEKHDFPHFCIPCTIHFFRRGDPHHKFNESFVLLIHHRYSLYLWLHPNDMLTFRRYSDKRLVEGLGYFLLGINAEGCF